MKFRKKTLLITASLTGLISVAMGHVIQLKKYPADRISQNTFKEKYAASIAQLHSAVSDIEDHFKQEETAWANVEIATKTKQDLTAEDMHITSAPAIQGIAWNSRQPLVMLNDTVYTTGDAIDSYIIEEILPDRIVIKDPFGDRKQIKFEMDSL